MERHLHRMASPSATPELLDQFCRPLRDLRISVIDACNFRCNYCMPKEEHYEFLAPSERLSFDEIEQLATIFVSLGVRKLRMTGGEPLMRRGLSELISRLSLIPGVEDLSLTTNGYLLSRYAGELKKAGLQRLTISVDTLNREAFTRLTSSEDGLDRVLEGITAAEEAGFKPIKINAVIRKGQNEDSILELAEEFLPRGHIVRYIEFMDVGNRNRWNLNEVVTSRSMRDKLASLGPLVPAQKNYFGEVASRYEFLDGSGEVGFISSVSQPFCGTCTRTRLSAEGKLYTCLFAEKGIDLRTPLRSGKTEEVLANKILESWAGRMDRYSEERAGDDAEGRSRKKVEMFHIGG